MLGLLRINDPYRLILVFVLLLIFRLPVIISGIPLSYYELDWMIVGEAMSSGKMMYRDIWDNLAPFAAYFYQVMDWLFGRSQLAYQLISLVLIMIQAIIFNRLLLINKAFNENTYIPALIYVICASSNIEFLTLSPALLSMTFVLLAINNIFKRIDNFTRDGLFLNTGIYLAIATLFYFPAFVFFVSTVLSLILFTSAIPRRLILMSIGFLQSIGIIAMYYYWFDSGKEFALHFVYAPFWLDHSPYFSGASLVRIMMVVLVFALLSFLKLYSRNYYVNFQVKFQSVMLITLLAGVLALLVDPSLAGYQLVVLIPSISFYLSHLFLLIEKRLRAEILFGIFLIAIFGYQIIMEKDLKWIGQIMSYENLWVKGSDKEFIKGRSLLVLGSDRSHYLHNSLSTPYYDWQLTQVHLSKMDYYDIVSDVYQNFQEDPPEVIIDEVDLAPVLFEKMPTIGSRYEVIGPNTYQLKD